jgi:putative endopeptidase
MFHTRSISGLAVPLLAATLLAAALLAAATLLAAALLATPLAAALLAATLLAATLLAATLLAAALLAAALLAAALLAATLLAATVLVTICHASSCAASCVQSPRTSGDYTARRARGVPHTLNHQHRSGTTDRGAGTIRARITRLRSSDDIMNIHQSTGRVTRRTAAALALAALAAAAAPLSAQAPAPQRPVQASHALGFDPANFDTTVRPQDDFYLFANGTWLRNTPIPADLPSLGSFDALRLQSEAALRTLLEEAAGSRSHPPGSDLQKVGDYYRSFLDSARIESLGVAPLRPELRRIAELSDHAALPVQFAHLQRLGVQTPLGVFVGQDQRQSDRYIASISQSGLGLPEREFYTREGESFERTRAAYLQYVETLLSLAGEQDAAQAAQSIFALESAIAAAHWDRVRNRDREATYNLKTMAELQQLAPSFDWAAYLGANGADRSPGFVVRQPDYLQALDGIIRATPVRTWQQYMTFKLLDAYAGVLPAAFVDAHFDFRGRVLGGLQEQRPRWTRAIAATEGALGEVAGRMYVERHFTPEARSRMQQLVDNLMEAFRQGIDELEWMSAGTKLEAQAKLARFNVKIGYPDEWRDYSELEVRDGDALGNQMRAADFGVRRMFGRLGQPIQRGEWGMTPQTVNAYYSPTMNEIVFPAAILQPPFFNLEADDAVNYGAIGGVIGHEISHGFDDQGSRSDGEGNLRDWWTAEDAAAFAERTGRLAEQYSGYCPLEGLCVDGRVALGENIGDLSGLTVAYRAYRLSLDGAEAPVIDGFTGDQRFFLGWAQIWRMNYREEALRQRVMIGPHSPNMYRVNGVVVNMPEFYEAFGVKPGDALYLPPEQRVKIW